MKRAALRLFKAIFSLLFLFFIDCSSPSSTQIPGIDPETEGYIPEITDCTFTGAFFDSKVLKTNGGQYL